MLWSRAAICCSLYIVAACASPKPVSPEQAFIQDVNDRLPREWRVELTGQSPQDWYPFAIGICDALLSGRPEGDVRKNVSQFYGPHLAHALISAARTRLCPGELPVVEMAAPTAPPLLGETPRDLLR